MGGAIGETFERLKRRGEKAFIPFITAGDPNLETTVRLVPEMARAGADIMELGVPFSDPLADGPTIQRSSQRALRHRYSLADYLAAVSEIRRSTDIPIVLFSYYNPIFQYGLEDLARGAQSVGINGILVTDMTPEEGEGYQACLNKHGLDAIFLAAPTSGPERLSKIVSLSRGFVYLVSRTGVTGTQEILSDMVLPTLNRIREYTDLPVAVGFGISTPDQVRSIWEIADGAVVGSAIVGRMERVGDSSELIAEIKDFCCWLTGRSYDQSR